MAAADDTVPRNPIDVFDSLTWPRAASGMNRSHEFLMTSTVTFLCLTIQSRIAASSGGSDDVRWGAMFWRNFLNRDRLALSAKIQLISYRSLSRFITMEYSQNLFACFVHLARSALTTPTRDNHTMLSFKTNNADAMRDMVSVTRCTGSCRLMVCSAELRKSAERPKRSTVAMSM